MTDEETALVRAAGFDLILSGFKDAEAANKAELRSRLVVGDRRGVVLPLDGEPVRVATVTYVNGSKEAPEAAIADEAAFLQWVFTNRPEAIHRSVAPWFTAEVLARAKAAGVAVTEDGEAIPGVTVGTKPAGRPYLKVERDKTPAARAALLGAIFENNAAGLRALLAIEPGTEQE